MPVVNALVNYRSKSKLIRNTIWLLNAATKFCDKLITILGGAAAIRLVSEYADNATADAIANGAANNV